MLKTTPWKLTVHQPEKWAGPRETRRPAARPSIGLGDWVEKWAKPIAVWIDRQSGRFWPKKAIKLAGCSACSRRRRLLNLCVPHMGAWESGWKGSFRRFATAWKRTYGRSFWASIRLIFRPRNRP